MKCKDCCTSFGFTILTILTIGTATALFGVALYYIATKFKDISNSLMTIIVICLCVSLLVLLVSIAISVKGNKCTKSILVFIYIIFALVVGAAAILLFAFKSKIMDTIENGVVANKTDLIHSIEVAFSCSMQSPSDPETLCFKNCPCGGKVDSFYQAKLPPIGGCLVGIFVVLIIGIIFSFRYLCSSQKTNDDTTTGQNPQPALNQSLTYGW